MSIPNFQPLFPQSPETFETSVPELNNILGGGLTNNLFVIGSTDHEIPLIFCRQLIVNLPPTQNVLAFDFTPEGDFLTAQTENITTVRCDKNFTVFSLYDTLEKSAEFMTSAPLVLISDIEAFGKYHKNATEEQVSRYHLPYLERLATEGQVPIVAATKIPPHIYQDPSDPRCFRYLVQDITDFPSTRFLILADE